jgi:cation transporter-like permease
MITIILSTWSESMRSVPRMSVAYPADKGSNAASNSIIRAV